MHKQHSFFIYFYEFYLIGDEMSKKQQLHLDETDQLEWLAQELHLPTEMLAKAPLLILNGKHQIWIENYRRILEYQEYKLKILTGQGKVVIHGKNLSIEEFTKDGMRVIGTISNVEFLNELDSQKGVSL